MIFWQLGHHGISKVEILEGKFLAVAGKSAKSSKILPLQNFALYGTS